MLNQAIANLERSINNHVLCALLDSITLKRDTTTNESVRASLNALLSTIANMEDQELTRSDIAQINSQLYRI